MTNGLLSRNLISAKMNNLFYMLLPFALMVIGCQNSLKDVERISSRKLVTQIDVSTGVQIIYSDSAIVKAKIITPELIHYKTNQPYYEMKKGMKAIFFDQQQQETSNIISDYALRREHEDIIELRKNVVATNKEGKVFKSDELIWNAKLHRFYTTKLVTILAPNQTTYGTEFWANEDFTYYEIQKSTGNFDVSDKGGSPPPTK